MDTLVREECNADTGECKEVNPDGILRVIKPLLSLTRTDIGMNQNIAEGSPFVGSGQLDGEGVPLNFFSDVHVRKAFNYCFDYETYIKDVQFGEADALTGVDAARPARLRWLADRMSSTWRSARKSSRPSTLDRKTAQGRLWDTGFYLQLGYNVGNTARQTMAEILAANLSQVNSKFLVNPVALPWPTYLRVVRVKQIPIGSAGWQEDIHDPHNWYVPYLLTTYGSRFNIAPELLEKYQPLIDAGAKETDFDEARRDLQGTESDDPRRCAVRRLCRYSTDRSDEQLYVNGWLGGTSQNPLVSAPGAVNELSKDNAAK